MAYTYTFANCRAYLYSLCLQWRYRLSVGKESQYVEKCVLGSEKIH